MPTEHIVKSFDEELNHLTNLLSEMGGVVETMVTDSLMALRRRDGELAARVITTDARVDDLEVAINQQATRLLALRQPMALDLRTILAAIKTAGDLERVGDYAANTAKRATALSETQPINGEKSLYRMGEMAKSALKDVLTAYMENDTENAETVRMSDEELDSTYTSLFRELLTHMMEDSRQITLCTHLMFAAKNVERIGDLATNIAEHLLFAARAEEEGEERPKDDNSSFTTL
ncbi:MAG: phosphate signaling complex protein PhoU [Magnetospiraceae bacterium]